MLDDSHVLADRIWFDNHLDWLKYLLFYNQTRITHTGDYMLVRPVLFAFNWFLDVFFRSSRDIHYWASVTIGFFSASTLFWITNKYIPVAGALALASGYMVFGSNFLVFESSHISIYLLGISLFALGLIILINSQSQSKNISFSSLIFLTTSTMCHELLGLCVIALTILSIMLTYVIKNPNWLYENKINKKFTLHLLFVTVFWILLYIGVMIVYQPPSFFSAGEFHNFSKYSLGGFVNHFWEGLKALTMPIIFTLPALFFSSYYLKKSHQFIEWKEKWMIMGFNVPLICLFVGLLFGRVITRGGFSPWYFVMYLYFAFIIFSIFLGYLLQSGRPEKIASWIIIISILTVSLKISDIRAKEIEPRATQAPIFSIFVDDVKTYFLEHPQQCFAGLKNENLVAFKVSAKTFKKSTLNISEKHKLINNFLIKKSQLYTILYYYSCGYRNNSHPVYLYVSFDEQNTRFNFNAISEIWIEKKYYKPIQLENKKLPEYLQIYQLASTKKSIGNIWWGTPQHSTKIHEDLNCKITTALEFSEASISFVSDDNFPIAYNFSIFLNNPTGKNYLITFRSNVVEITDVVKGQDSALTLEKLSTAETFLEAMTWTSKIKTMDSLFLSSISKNFLVSFKQGIYGTEIYFQKQFIGVLPTENNKQPTSFYICPFYNNTPYEHVVSFKYVKL